MNELPVDVRIDDGCSAALTVCSFQAALHRLMVANNTGMTTDLDCLLVVPACMLHQVMCVSNHFSSGLNGKRSVDYAIDSSIGDTCWWLLHGKDEVKGTWAVGVYNEGC